MNRSTRSRTLKKPSNNRQTAKKGNLNLFEKIEEVEKTFVELFNNHDAPNLVDLYTKHAQILAPNMEIKQGREALEGLFRDFWGDGAAKIELTTLEVQGRDDFVYEVGTYRTSGNRKGDAGDHGKYVVIWKKEHDKWKLHRDIFNSDVALPKSPEHVT